MASTSLKDYQSKFIILFPIHMVLCRKLGLSYIIVGPRCKSRTLISCFVSNILYSILQHFTRFLFQNRIKFGMKVVKTPSKSLMSWTDALSNKQVNTNEIDRKKILDFSCQRLKSSCIWIVERTFICIIFCLKIEKTNNGNQKNLWPGVHLSCIHRLTE